MKVFLLALVVAGALFVIASGIWVAFALAGVISSRRSTPEPEANSPE
ncbi:MAG: hypothetical protein JSW47_19985 [Phycisphaerales bacterium]|nr:MAG: hypothetical protein JSW47_19985 [Phycisphaerales bacterium]UCF15859.1 MAG: hypothetical protein JSW59_00060 [Phycisphaerales bacterium]